ncbi:MAG: hypothetical protein R6X02_28220, partial [Enhygromyxa sp.]
RTTASPSELWRSTQLPSEFSSTSSVRRVGWVWLVNPILRTLEVLENSEGSWVLRQSSLGDAIVRAPPFDAIELSLAELWHPDPQA